MGWLVRQMFWFVVCMATKTEEGMYDEHFHDDDSVYQDVVGNIL